jgi:hypothetical protein
MARQITHAEALDFVNRVLAADPWAVDSTENAVRVVKVFLHDPRITGSTIQDMVKALHYASEDPNFERTPPPEFPDEDLTIPLQDGSSKLPINATELQQRGATRAQSFNLLARLRRKELWEFEQQNQ